MMRLQKLSFDDWLDHSFGREVRFQQSPWYFDPEHDWWDPPPAEAVSYLTRLFEDPETALQGFADSQIAQGLTYLANTSASGDNRWLCSTDVCQSACKFDPSSASNFDPFVRRGLLVALVSSELAGIAEARRARVA